MILIKKYPTLSGNRFKAIPNKKTIILFFYFYLMNTRKILSTLVLMSTIVSFSQSTMAISINPHRTNYAPPAKIQRLMRLEPTLMKYIE